jgi:hypothetical protein
MSITGTGDIGTTWRSIADIGLAQETKAENDGFGLPTFTASGYWGTVGTGSLTTAAASFSGTGALTLTGTGTFTSAAASLSGTGAIVQAITGTGSLTTARATFQGRSERITLAAGHDRAQTKRYEEFVRMGEVIKGDLLGHLAPNELQSPEHAPQPLHLTVETREPDVQPDVPPMPLRVAPLPPMTLPEVRVKPTIVGTGTFTSDGSNLGGLSRNAVVNGYSILLTEPSTLQGRGTTDIHYAQRQQEDALIEQFLLQLVA